MKKILKWILIILILLILGLFIFTKIVSEPRPTANPSPEADLLANQMLASMNKPAWDTLQFLKWEFMGGHRYLWDKQNNDAVISWSDYVVVLDLDELTSVATQDGQLVEDQKNEKLKQTAWSFWCNDSFWMFAPFKVFDPGTTRSLVETEEGIGLMVSYESGGVTPGDAYLWYLDKNNRPTGYKMWTFLPLKGMYTSWENWIVLDGGAHVATNHVGDYFGFEMKDVKAGHSPEVLGYDADVFSVLETK